MALSNLKMKLNIGHIGHIGHREAHGGPRSYTGSGHFEAIWSSLAPLLAKLANCPEGFLGERINGYQPSFN